MLGRLTNAPREAAPHVVPFGVSDFASRRAGRDVSFRVELRRGTVQDGVAVWQQVLRGRRAVQGGRRDGRL